MESFALLGASPSSAVIRRFVVTYRRRRFSISACWARGQGFLQRRYNERTFGCSQRSRKLFLYLVGPVNSLIPLFLSLCHGRGRACISFNPGSRGQRIDDMVASNSRGRPSLNWLTKEWQSAYHDADATRSSWCDRVRGDPRKLWGTNRGTHLMG